METLEVKERLQRQGFYEGRQKPLLGPKVALLEGLPSR